MPVPIADAGIDLAVAVAVEIAVHDLLPVPRQGRGRIDADHAGVVNRIDLPIRSADQGEERPHLVVGKVGLLVVAVREGHRVGQGLVQTVARDGADGRLMVGVPHIVGRRMTHILEVYGEGRADSRRSVGDEGGRSEFGFLIRRDGHGRAVLRISPPVHGVDDLGDGRAGSRRRDRIAGREGFRRDFAARRAEGTGRAGRGQGHGRGGRSRSAPAAARTRTGAAAGRGTLLVPASGTGIAGEGMGSRFGLRCPADAGQGALVLAVGNRRPGAVVPGVGSGRGIVVDAAVVAVLPGLMLGARGILILPRVVTVGAGLGVPAGGTGVAGEGVVLPAGVSVSRQGLAAGIALRIIAVHIRVFVLAHLRRGGVGTGLFLMSADADTGGIVAVVFPAAVAPSFLHFSADRALRLVAVHVAVLDHIDLRPVVGARRRSGDGHQPEKRDDRQQQGEDSGKFLHLENTSFNQSRFHRSSI